jgi:hypothetical protein
MLDWINPEYVELVAVYRQLEEQPEAAGLPGVRAFVVPAAGTETDD